MCVCSTGRNWTELRAGLSLSCTGLATTPIRLPSVSSWSVLYVNHPVADQTINSTSDQPIYLSVSS